MHGLYPNDASIYDSAGRLLIVAFFVIVWLRNLSSHHIEDHVKRLTFFKAPDAARDILGLAWSSTPSAACCCLLNWHPAIGALCLIVFTVLASLLLLAVLGNGRPDEANRHAERLPRQYRRGRRACCCCCKT